MPQFVGSSINMISIVIDASTLVRYPRLSCVVSPLPSETAAVEAEEDGACFAEILQVLKKLVHIQHLALILVIDKKLECHYVEKTNA